MNIPHIVPFPTRTISFKGFQISTLHLSWLLLGPSTNVLVIECLAPKGFFTCPCQ